MWTTEKRVKNLLSMTHGHLDELLVVLDNPISGPPEVIANFKITGISPQDNRQVSFYLSAVERGFDVWCIYHMGDENQSFFEAMLPSLPGHDFEDIIRRLDELRGRLDTLYHSAARDSEAKHPEGAPGWSLIYGQYAQGRDALTKAITTIGNLAIEITKTQSDD